MVETIRDDEQTWYICGKCQQKVFYLKSEDPPIPCPDPDCNWHGKEMHYKRDIPPQIQVDLSEFTGG